MIKFQNIKLNIETLDLMRKSKIKFDKKTYDSLIIFSLKYLNNLDIENEKSKSDILLQNDADLKKRVEQLFKLIGSQEKTYFKKILDFPDITNELEKRLLLKIENTKPIVKIDKKETPQISEPVKEINKNMYENEIEELKNVIKNQSKKIYFLRDKFKKSTGFMKGSNYEASISEEEYFNTFE